MAQSDQLRVPEPARTDAKSFELLRVWIAHQDQHISMRVGVWKEPEAWGMMLADLARHIAAAFEQAEKRDPMEMLARIKQVLRQRLNLLRRRSTASLPVETLNDQIIIRGARTHNLKNIDCDLTHGKLTVVSGVSGSGKSSLAFDTIYAEGQRRYVESLSAYARQFLERIEKPDVDLIDGLAPAIAIKQKNTTRNPRSTVATATEIYDYLRLLFARCGTAHCIVCGGVVRRDTVDEIAASILALGEDTRLYALFPVKPRVTAEPEAGAPSGERRRRPRLSIRPFPTMHSRSGSPNCARADSIVFTRMERSLNSPLPSRCSISTLARRVYALVDRLVVSSENRARIVDAAEIGFRESGEIVYETVPRDEETEPRRLRFSQAFECKLCHRIYREPEPRLFSFNNPYGACERCQGFGNTIDFDLNLIIPDKQKTLNEGAIDPWTRPKYRPYQSELRKAAMQHGIPLDTPWRELTAAQQAFVLDGHGSFPRRARFLRLSRAQEIQTARARDAEQVPRLRYLSRVQRHAPACRGARGSHQRAEHLRGCRAHHPPGKPLLRGAHPDPRNSRRLPAASWSRYNSGYIFSMPWGWSTSPSTGWPPPSPGGEAQRIQLATSLGSRLVGALYVLDEPSIGLHSRDTAKLIRILEELRDLGNTILVVEHDPDVIRAADWLVDLGPGAGELGGRILAAGHGRRGGEKSRLAHRPLSERAAHHSHSHPAAGADAGKAGVARGPNSQSERAGCRNSHGHAGLHHRGFRLGQVHPGA